LCLAGGVVVSTKREGRPVLAPAAILGAAAYGAAEGWIPEAIPPEWRSIAMPAIGAIVGLSGLQLLRALIEFADYIRKTARALAESGTSHGTAGWASREEARAAGLHGERGIFIGVHEGEVVRFDNETHTLVLAPAGAGKTQCVALPQLGLVDQAMVVTDPKAELAAMTARYRAAVLGHRVVVLNGERLGFESEAYNPCAIVVEDLMLSPMDAMSDAAAIALQLMPEPPETDKNQFFRDGGRRIIKFVILGLAVRSPEEAHLAMVQKIVAHTEELLEMFEDLKTETALNGDIAGTASSLLTMASRREGEFTSCLSGAVQALDPFASSGRLARLSDRCTFRFRDLKKGKMTVYLVCDMTRMKQFAKAIALWNWAAMVELQRCGDNRPVIFLMDEASNFVVEGLPNAMTALRGYGIRLVLFVQELAEIKRAYGADALKTILSQTSLQMVFGVTSLEAAEHFSKKCGNRTIGSSRLALGQSIEDDIGESRGAMQRPLITADELRRMPEQEMLVFVGNLKPMRCLKIGAHEIEPLRSNFAPNPLHGNVPRKGEVLVRM